MDPDGIILEANQTVLEFLGYTEKDLIGKPFWEVMWRGVPPEEQSRIKDAIKDAAQGKLVRYQVDMVGKNNIIRTIDFSLKPVLNEQGQTVLIIPEGRDITELRQADNTTGMVVIQSRVLANDAIEVTVTDNGTGIDATMLNIVFDPFQTSKATGRGMGLSISRTIIEAHGGKLWVDKEPRTGACFGFELPVSE
jgi:PAS domain S-box-containing protein